MKNLKVAAFALALAIAPAAQAAIVSYTFTGGVSGVDPLGSNYALGPNFIGVPSYQEGGATNDGNDAVFRSGFGLANATSFTLTETGGTLPILESNSGFNQSDTTGEWDATFNADDTSVTFTAPSGKALVDGTPFFTFIEFGGFGGVTLPADFAYTITWSGEAAQGAVPEPASWAMMVGGFGLLGGAARRRKAGHAIA